MQHCPWHLGAAMIHRQRFSPKTDQPLVRHDGVASGEHPFRFLIRTLSTSAPAPLCRAGSRAGCGKGLRTLLSLSVISPRGENSSFYISAMGVDSLWRVYLLRHSEQVTRRGRGTARQEITAATPLES